MSYNSGQWAPIRFNSRNNAWPISLDIYSLQKAKQISSSRISKCKKLSSNNSGKQSFSFLDYKHCCTNVLSFQLFYIIFFMETNASSTLPHYIFHGDKCLFNFIWHYSSRLLSNLYPPIHAYAGIATRHDKRINAERILTKKLLSVLFLIHSGNHRILFLSIYLYKVRSLLIKC